MYMSTSSSSIILRPCCPPTSASSSSSNKYDPVRMGFDECIERIKRVAKDLNSHIPPKENKVLDCRVLYQPMTKPTVLNCGHSYDLSALEKLKVCPDCRAPIQAKIRNYALQTLTDERQQEERIPTLAHFKKENADEQLAAQHLELAKSYRDKQLYDEALAAYGRAFLHTKKSEEYAAVPILLYGVLNRREEAALACLYLALRQFEEGKAQKALITLESAKHMAPQSMKIDAILAAFRLQDHPSEEEIHEIMLLASKQKDPEEAVAIYKQVIAARPRQFEAYKALCSLLKNSEERLYFLSKAAQLAAQAKDPVLAESFRRVAERPVYPTSMTPEDWADPAEFMKRLPPKPQALEDFLAGDCPIYGPGTKASTTHFVVPLIKNITTVEDGVPVTKPRILKTLNELDTASGGTGCFHIWDEILKPEVDKPSEVEFEWAVMTKDVLPESRNESYDTQKRLAEDKGYLVPGFLDAATCILWAQRHLGIRLYGDNPWTYTRCREVLLEGHHLVVGGFAPDGLSVYYDYDDEDIGVAGLRKF